MSGYGLIVHILSCLHKLWLNHPVFTKLLPHCCCLPLRRPRRQWVEWSQWYLLLFIRCCLRGLGSCFKYLPWNVRCKSSHRVILWYCWPLWVVWWACWVSLLLLCCLRILKTRNYLISHLTGGRISWWKDVAEPPNAWRQLTNTAATKTAQRRYERLSKTVNIARIANAVKVTLWLSVFNPQCHD